MPVVPIRSQPKSRARPSLPHVDPTFLMMAGAQMAAERKTLSPDYYIQKGPKPKTSPAPGEDYFKGPELPPAPDFNMNKGPEPGTVPDPNMRTS